MILALQTQYPEFTKEQISNAWGRTIKQASGGIIGKFTSQATTTDRAGAITELAQRFYWEVVEAAELECERNSHGTDANGKTWRQRQDDFTFGLDEECNLANLDTGKVMGDRARSKHSKKVNDSRVSITTVHVGSAGG